MAKNFQRIYEINYHKKASYFKINKQKPTAFLYNSNNLETNLRKVIIP